MELVWCWFVHHPPVCLSIGPSLSGVNFILSNWIGSPRSHLIFPIFGLNVHNIIVQKLVGLEILLYVSNLFDRFFITKKYKIGILEVFYHSLIQILIWDHKTWFTGILWALSAACVKMAPVSQIFGPFFVQNKPKQAKIQVFVYFLDNFPLNSLKTWFISSLELLL